MQVPEDLTKEKTSVGEGAPFYFTLPKHNEA